MKVPQTFGEPVSSSGEKRDYGSGLPLTSDIDKQHEGNINSGVKAFKIILEVETL